MHNLPLYIPIVFGITTLLTVGLFAKAAGNVKATLIIILLWLAIQSAISLTGFYAVTSSNPPRFLLAVLPPVLVIIVLFVSQAGRRYIDNFSISVLTILHTIRVPVELVLFWLFINKVIPQLMTFEGRNFDILSGLSAPIIYFFGYIRKRLSNTHVLLWNFICLLLLINVVVNAILSAPFPFQQFAFDRPNIAVLYFPYILLPSCIVPIVLFSHLVAIRQLTKQKKKNELNNFKN